MFDGKLVSAAGIFLSDTATVAVLTASPKSEGGVKVRVRLEGHVFGAYETSCSVLH